MSENNNLTYYQRNREKILNKAKDYYKNLSEEDKIKRREYGKNRYHNMSEEKKQKLKEYQKKYREANKPKHNNKIVFLITI